MPGRPSKRVITLELAALAAAVAVAAWLNGDSNWDLALFAILLATSVAGELTAVDTPASRMVISSSFLTIVTATVFLGETPAAAIGVATMGAGFLRFRYCAEHPAHQPGDVRVVPADLGARIHGGSRGRRGRPDGRALLPVRVRALRRGPGDQLHPDRRLLQLRGRNLALDGGPPRARSPAPLRARLSPAGRRRRLPLRRVRPSDHRHVRRRRDRLPVSDRGALGLPAARRRARAAGQAARRASRSHC